MRSLLLLPVVALLVGCQPKTTRSADAPVPASTSALYIEAGYEPYMSGVIVDRKTGHRFIMVRSSGGGAAIALIPDTPAKALP